MKCLVVDGSATMRPILSRAARLAGFQDVQEAATGALALEYDLSTIDLLVVDWASRDDDIVALLRRDESTQVTPRVLVTATADAADEVRAIGESVDALLVKPFAPTQFAAAVEDALAAPA